MHPTKISPQQYQEVKNALDVPIPFILNEALGGIENNNKALYSMLERVASIADRILGEQPAKPKETSNPICAGIADRILTEIKDCSDLINHMDEELMRLERL